MNADKETARALSDSFTEAEIRDYRLNALKIKLEGGTVTRNYEGSSFTIHLENCSQIIADTNEAIAIKDAVSAAESHELIQEPCGRGIDFSQRCTA